MHSASTETCCLARKSQERWTMRASNCSGQEMRGCKTGSKKEDFAATFFLRETREAGWPLWETCLPHVICTGVCQCLGVWVCVLPFSRQNLSPRTSRDGWILTAARVAQKVRKTFTLADTGRTLAKKRDFDVRQTCRMSDQSKRTIS